MPNLLKPGTLARDFIGYLAVGLTAGTGGALIFRTYSYLETGRTSYNAPAVDHVLRNLKRENAPTVVFYEPPYDNIRQRVEYWQQLSNATIRAATAEPAAYIRSVGWALIGTTHPAIGRQQLVQFFGVRKHWFRVYQGAHFLLFALAIGAIAIGTVSMLWRLQRRSFRELYLVLMVGAVMSDLVLTALLINGPNNRYRMPFDGAILMMALLSMTLLSRRSANRPKG